MEANSFLRFTLTCLIILAVLGDGFVASPVPTVYWDELGVDDQQQQEKNPVNILTNFFGGLARNSRQSDDNDLFSNPIDESTPRTDIAPGVPSSVATTPKIDTASNSFSWFDSNSFSNPPVTSTPRRDTTTSGSFSWFDSNSFSNPINTATPKRQTVTSAPSGDSDSFSNPNRRRPSIFHSIKNLLLEQILGTRGRSQGSGSGDEPVPWYRTLGRIVLQLVEFGTRRLRERQNANNNNNNYNSNNNFDNK